MSVTENSEEGSSVRLAFDTTSLDPEGAPSPDSPEPSHPPRRWIALSLLAGLALVGALLWLARPEDGVDAASDPIVAPTSTSVVVASTAPSSAPMTTEAMETGSLDGSLRSIVHAPSGLFALQAVSPAVADGTAQLVRSDDGLDWDRLLAPPRRFIDLAVDETDPVILRSLQFVGEDGRQAGEFDSVDGVNWFPVGAPFELGDLQEAPFGVLTDDGWVVVGRVVADAPIGDVSVALHAMLSEDPPRLLGIDGEPVDPAIAEAVCAIDHSSGGVTPPVFDLRDCGGGLLASVRTSSATQQRTMEFAATILEAQFTLSAGGRDRAEQIRLEPGTFPQYVIAAGDRVLILTLDVLFAIDEPNRLLAQGIPWAILEWSPAGGVRTLDSPVPTRSWRGHRLVGLDGDVILASTDGVFVLDSGRSATWTPFEPPTPRSELILSTGDGRAVFTVTSRPLQLLVSSDLDDWVPVPVDAASVDDVLALVDESVIVLVGDGTTLRVPLDPTLRR